MKKSTAHLFVFLLFSPLSMVSSYFASNFLFDRQEEVAKDYIWQEMNSNESGYVTSFLRSEKTISEIDFDWKQFATDAESNADLEVDVSKYYGPNSISSFAITDETEELNNLAITVLDTSTYEKEPYYSTSHVYCDNPRTWRDLENENAIYVSRSLATKIASSRGLSNVSLLIGADIILITPKEVSEQFIISGIFRVNDGNDKSDASIYLNDIYGGDFIYLSRTTSAKYQTNRYVTTLKHDSKRKMISFYETWSHLKTSLNMVEEFSSESINVITGAVRAFYSNSSRFVWGTILILLSLLSTMVALMSRSNVLMYPSVWNFKKLSFLKNNFLNFIIVAETLLMVGILRFVPFRISNNVVLTSPFQGSVLLLIINVALILIMNFVLELPSKQREKNTDFIVLTI